MGRTPREIEGPWHTPAPEKRTKIRAQDRDVAYDMRVSDMGSVMDADIARAFALVQQQDLRFVPELKAWVFWDEKKARWVQDIAGDVAVKHRLQIWLALLAQDKGKQAYRAKIAAGGTEEEAEKACAAVETKLKSTTKLSAVFYQVKCEPTLITSLRHFDADPWTLNTPDGPIDLWTGERATRQQKSSASSRHRWRRKPVRRPCGRRC